MGEEGRPSLCKHADGQYYTDRSSGESKPGKKGISLSAEQVSRQVTALHGSFCVRADGQWAAVKANIGSIDEMLAEVEKK